MALLVLLALAVFKGLAAVSYTHLDVYQRQVLGGAHTLFMGEKLDIDFQHDSSSFLQHVDLDFHIGHPQGAGVLFLQALQVELEPLEQLPAAGLVFWLDPEKHLALPHTCLLYTSRCV